MTTTELLANVRALNTAIAPQLAAAAQKAPVGLKTPHRQHANYLARSANALAFLTDAPKAGIVPASVTALKSGGFSVKFTEPKTLQQRVDGYLSAKAKRTAQFEARRNAKAQAAAVAAAAAAALNAAAA